MKILVVCQYFYPENFQINAICSDLVKRGHQVTVLTGLPNYPTGVIPEEYKHGKRRNEVIHGVHIIRCFEVGRKKGILGMAANYVSYCLSASVKALVSHFDFDVIYVYQLSPVLMALPAVCLKKKYKKSILLYCCDLWPESVKLYLKNENSLIYKIIARISTYLYKEADRIAIQSRSFYSYFIKQHKINKKRLCYIPQFGDDTYLGMDFNESHDTTNFVFLGNIGIAQDMDCILKTVRLLKNELFKVHIVGDGSYLNECKDLVKKYDISDKVIFYGRRPVEEMPDFYRLADACLLTLKDDLLIGRTIPSKLQGYMAAGKPILGAIDGDAQEIIKDAKCGLCVNASDFNGLAQIMREFIENRDAFKSFGENGRQYFAEHFTQKIHVDKIERELSKQVEGERHVSV